MYSGWALTFQSTLLLYAQYNLPKRKFPSTKLNGVTARRP